MPTVVVHSNHLPQPLFLWKGDCAISGWGAGTDGCPHAQAVVITDPVLATQILRSKAVDKLRFMYSFLDVVRP